MKLNLKNSTLILLVLAILFGIITLMLPSRDKIREVEVRKIEVKKDELVDLTVYTATKNSENIEKYVLTVKQDIVDNLLKKAVEDMLNKYSPNIELVNIYFGDGIVYYEFSSNDLSEPFVEALRLTTKEVSGIEEINILEH